jgi:hypothetical protein
MRDRQARYQARIVKKQDLVASVMSRAGIKKISEPDFTAYLRSSTGRLKISDKNLIPCEYWVEQEPKLDKNKLSDSLASCHSVPGAYLGDTITTVSVRVR